MKDSDHTARQELEEIIAEAAWRGNQEFNWKSHRSWNEIKGSTRDRWRYVASVVVDVLNGESKMPDDDLRTGAFWERHNKLMQDPERAAQFDTELARIRAVDAQVNDDDDLRTALEALVTDVQDEPHVVLKQIRALLDAHPAPVVSDTRREDVEALRGRHGAMTWEEDNYAAGWEHALDAVLAVLPAPPVVDETELRERIAQEIWDACPTGTDYPWPEAFVAAARIARGTTRG